MKTNGLISGEDHVGKLWLLVDNVDLDSELLVGINKHLPLLESEIGVGGPNLHPWVNLIVNVEMGRTAHEDARDTRC